MRFFSDEKIIDLTQKNENLLKKLENLENDYKILEKNHNELENIKEKHKNQANFLKYEKKMLKETFDEKENSLRRRYEEELQNKENLIFKISEERDRSFSKKKQKEQKLNVKFFKN